MSEVIRWEDPPGTTSAAPGRGVGRSYLIPLAEELMSRPGEWALVFEGAPGRANTLATHIRLGHVLCFSPAGDFDATTRVMDEADRDVTRVYARYVGDPS